MASSVPDSAPVLRRFNRITLRLFALLGRIRPDERRDVVGAFLTLFAFMVGHALLETARDALFLASLSARRLPWVYLAIAVVALGVGHREPRVVRRLSARNELSRWLVAAGVITAGFWLFIGDDVWALYSLYVWSGIIVSLVVVRFWTILAARFTVTQAKRVFPVIATGSVVGAIVGSALARGATALVEPRHLVLGAAIAFLAASTAPTLLDVQETHGRPRGQWSDLGEVVRAIQTRPYLLRIATMVLLATVTFTLVDFVFKSVADELVPAAELGSFFASTYLAINLLSLAVQLIAVGWLLGQFGLTTAIIFVPAILLVSSLGFAVVGGLTAGVVLKTADGGLRHSLYRTGAELLFVPLSDRLRAQVKGIIDVLGQRGGQALASVVILMMLSTPATTPAFAALACVTAAAWLVVATSLKEHYLDLFRETLHPETERGSGGFPALDVASIDALLATLSSPDDRRVIAALDLLDGQGQSSSIPPSILYHPSPAVVARATELFIGSGRDETVVLIRRLVRHVDPTVRATALRALSVLAPERVAFEEAFRDGDPAVVATARAAFVACGWDQDRAVEEELLGSTRSAAVDVRRAVAAALRVRPSTDLEPLLLDLLEDPDASVAREAAAAAGQLRAPGLVTPLIHCLGRRSVREEARFALTRFGPLAVTRLSEALESRTISPAVRSQLPGALALSGSSQAPQVLLRHLEDETDGLIRFKVLRALGRWRREQPAYPMDGVMVQDAIQYAVSTAFELMEWRHTLEAGARAVPARKTEVHDVLVALLRDKQDHALERAFRLLNLQSGSDEYQRVYRGLHSPLPRSRAGSRELLVHMVVPPLREPLATLLDDLHGEHDAHWRDPESTDLAYASALRALIGCGTESASSLAATHAVELRVEAVKDALEATTPLSDDHDRVLDRSRRALGATEAA
ncbi:MAG: HEAT repeat domain-containing protein [Gemmatimonadetes bacterium]|nr:HEAT repeat domain-containing protein [Gemmatimonadota bacterium]